jgi:outer membrane receptor for ferrienterochelin and colicin
MAGGADINPTVNTTRGSQGDWHSREASGSAALDAILSFDPVGLIAGASAKGIFSATDGGTDGYTMLAVAPSDTITGIWSVKGGLSATFFNNDAIVYVNGGRFSNHPSLRQRYGAQGAHNPNPELVPETGYTGELGAKLHYNDLFTELCGFYNRSYEKILTIFDGRQSASINCSGSRTYGVESSLLIALGHQIDFDSRVTLQHTENLARQYNWYGRQLPCEPDITIRETVTFEPLSGLSLRYGIDLTSFYFINPANAKGDRVPRYEPNGDSDFWNLFHHGKIEWKASRYCTVAASAINVTSRLLTSGETAYSGESGYSWVLCPKNQLYLSIVYSF